MTEETRREMLKDIRDGYIDAWDNLAIDELFKEIEKDHEELKEYKKAEEKGSLFKVPCKIGDAIYLVLTAQDGPKYDKGEIEDIVIDKKNITLVVYFKEHEIYVDVNMNDCIGKGAFFTEEEAKLECQKRGMS